MTQHPMPIPDAGAAGTHGAPIRNRVGLAALIVAALLVVAQTIAAVLTPFIPEVAYRLALGAAEILALVRGPIVVLAIVATVLGIVGLLRSGRPRLAAAVGAAVGIATLVPTLLGATVGPFLADVVL